MLAGGYAARVSTTQAPDTLQKYEPNMKIAIRYASLATLLIIVAACGSGDTTEEHIARANQFIAGSDYDSAVIELKNALQKDNQSGEARWLLGKVYLDSGDILAAEKELKRAQELGWSPDDVIP